MAHGARYLAPTPRMPAEMSRLSVIAQRKLADYYTGQRLSFWRATAGATLNPKDLHWGKTSAWMTYGRIDWVHLDELTLLPGNATATASAEFRSNEGVVNRMDYSFHLVDTSVGWRIDREAFEFLLDYGP